jgi:hypothetical protein
VLVPQMLPNVLLEEKAASPHRIPRIKNLRAGQKRTRDQMKLSCMEKVWERVWEKVWERVWDEGMSPAG